MIKNTFVRVIRKIFVIGAGVDFRQKFDTIDATIAQQGDVVRNLSKTTLAVEELAVKLRNIENYQPVYGIEGLVDTPSRSSVDRCEVILDTLGDVSGMRILDIGSSLGYISFFLADRNAQVQGWEASPQNAEVARLIGHINGVPVDFRTKELNIDTSNTIAPDYYDVAIVLSVFHHIIRFQGLEATQAIVKTILEKIPVMIVELAKKGEDPDLPWDKSQPENELDIFADLDVTITKIGSFGNHLSKNKRPLYLVEANKAIKVNNKSYAYETVTHAAYKNSPLRRMTSSHRKYYFSKDNIIKEYGLSQTDEKVFNIPEANTEIATLASLNKMKKKGLLSQSYPTVVDAEVNPKLSRIVIKRSPGMLLSDLSSSKTDLNSEKIINVVLRDVLAQLAELRGINVFHNDVRSWNIIFNSKTDSALLIDYGNASPVAEQNDVAELLWAASNFIKGNNSETGGGNDLPTQAVFKNYKIALQIHKLVSGGTTDPQEISNKVFNKK